MSEKRRQKSMALIRHIQGGELLVSHHSRPQGPNRILGVIDGQGFSVPPTISDKMPMRGGELLNQISFRQPTTAKKARENIRIDQMADFHVYEQSFAPQTGEKDEIFQSRNYTFLPDNNNGNYNNGSSINFQLESVASNGRFVDWGNSFLTIPLVLNCNLKKADGTPAFTAAASRENVFAASMKNLPCLFHQMQVSISNLEVVQNAAFSNLDIQYRLMSTLNSDSLKTLGPSILFSPDTTTMGYDVRHFNGNVGGSAAANALSDVANFGTAIEANNCISAQSFVPSAGYAGQFQNKGRVERMVQTSFDATQLLAVDNAATGAPTNAAFTGKNFVAVDQPNGNITYYILAIVPLKILHPIFEKLPLVKGAVVKINLFTNTNVSFTSTITRGSQTTNPPVGNIEYRHTSTNTVSAFGVVPFQISPISSATSAAATSPITSRGLCIDAVGIAAGDSVTLIATLGIAKALPPQTYSHPTMTTCRIYFSTLVMNPIIEEQYFSQLPSKTVLYEDRQAPFYIMGVGPNQNRTTLIQNGISRARYLLVVPKITPGTLGAVYTTAAGAVVTLDPWNAPFSSGPSTAAPYGWMTNANVIVSGSNLFQQPMNMSWEFFLQQVHELKNVDGGLDLSTSCGLINQNDWEAAPYYVFNLARRDGQASDDVSKSYQLSFTNASALTLDYYCVIVYERQLTISTSTGTLII